MFPFHLILVSRMTFSLFSFVLISLHSDTQRLVFFSCVWVFCFCKYHSLKTFVIYSTFSSDHMFYLLLKIFMKTFSNVPTACLCQKQVGCKYVDLFLSSRFALLVCITLFSWECHCVFYAVVL